MTASEEQVAFDLNRARIIDHDPLWTNLGRDPRLGLLFIELATRRRYRVNGDGQRSGTRLSLAVREAYPNCPKYIQRRYLRSSPLRGFGVEPGVFRSSGFGVVEALTPELTAAASQRALL